MMHGASKGMKFALARGRRLGKQASCCVQPAGAVPESGQDGPHRGPCPAAGGRGEGGTWPAAGQTV